jgi:hypothetical protein
MSVLISEIVAIFLGLEIFILIHHKDTKIALIGSWESARVPDLMIFTEEVVTALGSQCATITSNISSPLLGMEVVSTRISMIGTSDRSMRPRVSSNNGSSILRVQKVTILSLVDRLYEKMVYEGDRSFLSVIIPNLGIMAIEIFLAADSYYNCLTSIENR